MYFVYILLCSDNSLYTGITNNLDKRFRDHTSGKGGAYTRSHPPVKIVFSETHPDKSSALKREHQIKRWTHQEKVDILKLKL